MRIVINRKHYPKFTAGTLTIIDGYPAEKHLFSCHTLERPWLQNKQGESCVPDGTYPLVLEYSEKFKRFLWELYEVPNRSECKIHTANYVHQLEGCIAPGLQIGDINSDGIPDMKESALALQKIHETLGARKYCTIEIRTE